MTQSTTSPGMGIHARTKNEIYVVIVRIVFAGLIAWRVPSC